MIDKLISTGKEEGANQQVFGKVQTAQTKETAVR